jgi:DNA-binding winged helix-turn-helix (wHTH) protein
MSSTPPGSEGRERVVYEFDGFRADPVRRVLTRHGEPVAITPKALSILLVLLERAGEVVEKKELIARVWPGVFVSEGNLAQNVLSLRKSLGQRGPEGGYVVTVTGEGYSFAGEVRRVVRVATSELPLPVIEPPPAASEEVSSESEGSAAVAGELAAGTAAPAPSRGCGLLGILALLLVLAVTGAAIFGLSPG